MSRRWKRLAHVLFVCALIGSGRIPAGATASIVRCPADDLTAAIEAASPGDTIRIGGTCVGNFLVGKPLTLWGHPGATLDGGDVGTTLRITARGNVEVRGLRITGGSDRLGPGAGIRNSGRLLIRNSVVTRNGGELEGSLGGGIYNTGSLSLVHSVVSHNFLGGFFSSGGAVYSRGRLEIRNSTLTNNLAYDGGTVTNDGIAFMRDSTVSRGDAAGAAGIQNNGELTLSKSAVIRNGSFFLGGIGNSGIATITDSTIAENSGGVGGIANAGGSMTLTRVTVSGNSGTEFEGPGGIFNVPTTATPGVVLLRGSIVAGNTGQTINDCGGTVSSKGYNLIGDADGCTVTAARGDLIGSSSGAGVIDPMLGTLAFTWGPTQTMSVSPSSPARNAIPVGATATGGTALCPPTGTADQRHVPRPQGPGCDIGAFERKAG